MRCQIIGLDKSLLNYSGIFSTDKVLVFIEDVVVIVQVLFDGDLHIQAFNDIEKSCLAMEDRVINHLEKEHSHRFRTMCHKNANLAKENKTLNDFFDREKKVNYFR